MDFLQASTSLNESNLQRKKERKKERIKEREKTTGIHTS